MRERGRDSIFDIFMDYFLKRDDLEGIDTMVLYPRKGLSLCASPTSMGFGFPNFINILMSSVMIQSSTKKHL
jgi:hypothetical protein